jgi:hypothetical protein
MDIFIKEYLTETKLREVLHKIIKKEDWLYTDRKDGEIQIPNSRRRWDIGFTYDQQTYIVEFDGAQHYYDSLVIKSDNIKDEIAKKLNYKTIRIPYFVQLTNETFKYYFPFIKEQINIIQNYSHGFIDKKAMLPASFSKLGLSKYFKETESLPYSVLKEIRTS